MLGCVAIGGGKDELGARERCKVLCAFLAIGFGKLGEAVDAKHEGPSEPARGLQAVLDRRQAVERMDLVEEEPGAQIARARQAHQRVHGKVHPEREERAIEDQFVVRGSDEQDRSGLVVIADPVANREGFLAFRKEPQSLRIGVEHRADRFRHLRRFGRGQRIGDGILEQLVDRLEVGHHQSARERLVGRLTQLDKAHAGLDEKRARSQHPEGFRSAAIGGQKRGGNAGKVGMVLRFGEDRPGRAALVHGIEDRVGLGVVEGLDIGAGEIEDDGPVAALAHLRDQRAHLRRLAGSGRADHHRVRLFGAPGEGHTGERIGMMDARCLALDKRHSKHLVHGPSRQAFGDFLSERGAVVIVDDGCKIGRIDEHRAALMALLEDRLSAPPGEVDEPHRNRHGDEKRDKQRAPYRAHHPLPGDDDIGVRGDHADGCGNDLSRGQGEVDHLGIGELHELPSGSIDPHANHLNFVFVKP